jgi:drug/metabolite transporter (DMT)-like permease
MLKNITKERQGEIFIFGSAVQGGLFPIIVVLSYNSISAPMSLSLSTFIAAIFFGVMLTIKKKWHELLIWKGVKNIFLTTLYLGILSYIFLYYGLIYTSPGNASIIELSGILFSFLFFHVFRNDYISKEHVLGSILMVLGALIILYPSVHGFRVGDVLVLISAIFVPIGNFYAQKARLIVSSTSILFARNLLTAVFVFILSVLFKQTASFLDLKSSLLFLLINGVLTFGVFRVMWIEGIHRISVTKASALSALSPLITLLFAGLILKTAPGLWQILSFVPMFLGVLLLSRDLSRHDTVFKK